MAGFLTADQLPDADGYGWKRAYITEVGVEHPLPDTCGNALGTEITQGVWDARYPAAYGRAAVEDVYTYSSASYAASRVTAAYPKCGGVTAHPADGFAWRDPDGLRHVLFARVGNKVATLVITVGQRAYDSALDARILTAMTQRLAE